MAKLSGDVVSPSQNLTINDNANADAIGDAFFVGALLATVASTVALAVLPKARHFLPKLQLNPHAMPIH